MKRWALFLGVMCTALLGAQSVSAAETNAETAQEETAETTEESAEEGAEETSEDAEEAAEEGAEETSEDAEEVAEEGAESTSEETAEASEKPEENWKKGGFTADVSVHDPSVIEIDGTYYIFGSHMDSAKSTDLRKWTSFSTGVNAENPLFDNLFDGEEEGDPAAFTYVGKNEQGGYSVWAPDVIYNEAMGKYVMYFCTTSSYVKSNICFATADNIEGPYHYVDTFLYSGYNYHDVKTQNVEELMGTNPRPYTGSSYDNNNWPNCIDPDVFYDEDGRLWMVYGSWSGGIFLIEIDEETGYPIYPEADEENHVDSYYGKKLLGGYHNSIEGPHILYDDTSGHGSITDVEAVAVYNEEKEEVTIFAVNRNLKEDVVLTTDVRSFEGYKVAEHIVLESDDLKVVNAFGQENVKPVNTDQTTMDNGTLTSMLHKASWNVIRLVKA